MKPGWGILKLAFLLCAALPATGCSTVCPAVGYASIVTVTVAGDASAVDQVQMCSSQGCSARQPDYGPAVVRALSAGRTVLAEQENDLVWTRVGGSEQCGGPVTTPPIILHVP